MVDILADILGPYSGTTLGSQDTVYIILDVSRSMRISKVVRRTSEDNILNYILKH